MNDHSKESTRLHYEPKSLGQQGAVSVDTVFYVQYLSVRDLTQFHIHV